MPIHLNPDLSVRSIDDEVFIYDRNHSLIHTFNRTGAFLWHLLEQNTEKTKMVETLTEKYEVSIFDAERDVGEFLEILLNAGLVTDVVS